tara:strand:- start:210 stop:368 length:159 start_codon:yes stop_codon:yes gene_type:complete
MNKNKIMQLVHESVKRAIEIESMNLKPDEKVIVKIDTDHPEGIKIHAKKIKK